MLTISHPASRGGEFPVFPVWLHVYVPNVDATYQRALEAGGTSAQEPSQVQGEPDRRGRQGSCRKYMVDRHPGER